MKMYDTLRYLWLGFTHVIPLGFDHILFMVNLFFLNTRLRTVILYCTLFTLAHSITLALWATGAFKLSSHWVEPVISFSVLATAVANLIGFHSRKGFRIPLIVLFGLFHGMGFASALDSAGLSGRNFVLALLLFNAGVELAQVLVVLSGYFLIVRPYALLPWYRERIVKPVSAGIACVAMYWTVMRLMG